MTMICPLCGLALVAQAESAPPEGVWAAYAYDAGPYLISVHTTEVEALRAAIDGNGSVAWLPFEEGFPDAVAASLASRTRYYPGGDSQ